jgi:VWFA-related protein
MKSFAVVFTLAFLLFNFGPPFLAQTAERKKPKIKDFGSSLKSKSKKRANSQKPPNQPVSDDVIKIDTNLVVLDCLVVDKNGKIVTGLRPEDFTVSEDNVQQKIEFFSLGDDANVPRSIVLVIDYSPSQKPYIELSVEAAKLLIDKLRPNDLMAIVTDDVELIAQFTADKNTLKQKLDSLKKKPGFFRSHTGESKQFSALYAVYNEMFDEEDIRPIIIFQTDGDELLFLSDHHGNKIYPDLDHRKTKFSSRELIDLISKSRASLFSIFVGAKLLGLSEEEKQRKRQIERLRQYKYWEIDTQLMAAQDEEERKLEKLKQSLYPDGVPDEQQFMSDLSQQTGGWLEFLEEPEAADGIYTRILSELNTRYMLGYLPTNDTKDGKRRTVKIEVKNHPEYKVLGKKTYLAEEKDLLN